MVRSREVPTHFGLNGLMPGAGDQVPLKRKGYFRHFPHPSTLTQRNAAISASAIGSSSQPMVGAACSSSEDCSHSPSSYEQDGRTYAIVTCARDACSRTSDAPRLALGRRGWGDGELRGGVSYLRARPRGRVHKSSWTVTSVSSGLSLIALKLFARFARLTIKTKKLARYSMNTPAVVPT